MNKRIILTLVLIASAALLGLALYFLTRETPDAGSRVSAPEKTPADYIYYIGETGDIRTITVRNNYGEYTMTGGYNPVIVGYEDYPISNFYFLHFLDVASRLESAGFVTDNEENLSIFGLAPAQAQLDIKSFNGVNIKLDIGYVAPDNNMYVRLENSSAVHLAYYFDVSVFLYNIDRLIDTAVSPTARKDQDDNLLFDRIILGGQAREEIVIVRNNSSGNLMNMNLSPYRIISPLNVAAGMEHIDIYESLFGLYADWFTARVSDNAALRRDQLDNYGLLQPWSTLELVIDGISYRTLFSKPDSADYVYIMRDGTPFVYESLSGSFPWLNISHFELMDKMVILPSIDSVASIDLKTLSGTVTFAISGTEQDLSVQAAGGDLTGGSFTGGSIDTRNFRIFYQNLVGARYDEYNDIPVNTLTSPFLEIVYRYRDSSLRADTVSFYETSSRRVLTSLNNGRAHFTLSVYTDKLLSDLQLILAGERIRAYL